MQGWLFVFSVAMGFGLAALGASGALISACLALTVSAIVALSVVASAITPTPETSRALDWGSRKSLAPVSHRPLGEHRGVVRGTAHRFQSTVQARDGEALAMELRVLESSSGGLYVRDVRSVDFWLDLGANEERVIVSGVLRLEREAGIRERRTRESHEAALRSWDLEALAPLLGWIDIIRIAEGSAIECVGVPADEIVPDAYRDGQTKVLRGTPERPLVLRILTQLSRAAP